MSKFKIGDRVRYVGNTDNKTLSVTAIGRIGTVTGLEDWGNEPQVNVTWDGGHTGYTRPYEHNLVLEGPQVSLTEVVDFLRDEGFYASAENLENRFTPKEAVTLKIEGTPKQVKAAQEAIKALSNITVEEVK